MNFFNPDSEAYALMSSFADMVLLNLCFIVGCLPIFSIGASVTAMYTIFGRRLRGESGGVIVPFFQTWWKEIKLSTVYWLMELVIVLLLLFDIRYASLNAQNGSGMMSILSGICIFLLVFVVMIGTVLYPQLARFQNTFANYLKNSMILCMGKLGWVLLNLLVFAIPFLFYFAAPKPFIYTAFIWPAFGLSALFYLSARIMRHVLKPLEPKTEEPEKEETEKEQEDSRE